MKITSTRVLFFTLFIIACYGMGSAQTNAVNFTAVDIDGNKIALSSFYDKVVILDFWATWCPPCKKEIPNLVDIKNTYKNHKFEIISIDGFERGEGTDKQVVKFVRENNMNWIHIIDKKLGTEIAEKYNVQALPSMFIIKNGKIVESNLRGEELKRRIGELLK